MGLMTVFGFDRLLRMKKVMILAVCLLACLPVSLKSHPHMWIDLQSEVVFGKDNQIAAISQQWLLGYFSSAALLEDASLHPDGVSAGLDKQVGDIINNLHEWNYFTHVMIDGEPASIDRVTGYKASIQDNRVRIEFTTALLAPAELSVSSFSYSIYDPTYYIEMFHSENAVIGFSGQTGIECEGIITEPDPSSEAVQLSQSPELDSEPDGTLGQLFAETVRVSCQ